jgi:hypothetical protein
MAKCKASKVISTQWSKKGGQGSEGSNVGVQLSRAQAVHLERWGVEKDSKEESCQDGVQKALDLAVFNLTVNKNVFT